MSQGLGKRLLSTVANRPATRGHAGATRVALDSVVKPRSIGDATTQTESGASEVVQVEESPALCTVTSGCQTSVARVSCDSDSITVESCQAEMEKLDRYWELCPTDPVTGGDGETSDVAGVSGGVVESDIEDGTRFQVTNVDSDSSSSYFLPCKIGGKQINCLVDTGCTANLVSKEVVDRPPRNLRVHD